MFQVRLCNTMVVSLMLRDFLPNSLFSVSIQEKMRLRRSFVDSYKETMNPTDVQCVTNSENANEVFTFTTDELSKNEIRDSYTGMDNIQFKDISVLEDNLLLRKVSTARVQELANSIKKD